MKNTIVFNTYVEAVLWKYELTGQFSDGMWENSKPRDHWKFWCDCDVRVDEAAEPCVELASYDSCLKDRYNFNALIPIIGSRMLALVRAALAFGEGALEYDIAHGSNVMPPTYDEWVKWMAAMASAPPSWYKPYTDEQAQKFYTQPPITNFRYLRAVFNEIKFAMKNRKVVSK